MSLIRQLNVERKARLERMNAHAVPDVPMDLKRKSESRVIKICGEEPKNLEGKLILVLQAQVASLQEELQAALRPRPQAIMVEEPIREGFPQRPTIANIKRVICGAYGCSEAELESHRRNAKINMPRQIAMHLSRKLTINSLPMIGRLFGNRDHTTVLHADQKITRWRLDDMRLDAELTEYERMIVA